MAQVALKLAEFVAKNGRSFEDITRERNQGDTPFKCVRARLATAPDNAALRGTGGACTNAHDPSVPCRLIQCRFLFERQSLAYRFYDSKVREFEAAAGTSQHRAPCAQLKRPRAACMRLCNSVMPFM